MNKMSQAATARRLEEQGTERKLRAMFEDESLATVASYSANAKLYPDHEMPFVDKHMTYLMAHPKVDPDQYLSNLRLMLRKR